MGRKTCLRSPDPKETPPQMSRIATTMRRALLPLGVFGAAVAAHYLWSGFFPEADPIQSQWAQVAVPASCLKRYLETQSYFLGYSYGLSLAFAAAALRRYRERRSCAARNLALGSITLSGALALAGCFLAGCCGSPMLAVYLTLLGAWFLPVAKPLVAALTTITILAAWAWLNRGPRQSGVYPNSSEASDPQDNCPWG